MKTPVQPWERRFKIALVLLLALMLLPLLGRVPRAYVDDSWSAARAAYTLAFEGRSRNPGHMGRGGVDVYMIEPRLFPSVIGAVMYRPAGFGLLQGRLVSVVFAGIFVFSMYGLIRRLFGPVAAAAASLLTAVDPWVFICGRTYREEIFLAALLWLAWWLLLPSVGGGNRLRACLGGVCLGLGCWTHPNVAVFAAASAVAFVVVIGHSKIMRPWLPAAIIGGIIGVAPYLTYVLYVQGVSEVRLLEQISERTGALLRPWGAMLATEGARWINFLRLPDRMPLLLLYVWALGCAAWRGQRGDRLLLVMVLGSVLFMPFLQGVSTGRYCVILVPAFAALLWRSLPRMADSDWGSIGAVLKKSGTVWACAACLLGVYLLMTLLPTMAVLYAHRCADYRRWVEEIARKIPPDATVMANTVMWTGLHDHRFISSEAPTRKGRPDVDAAVAHIEKYRPDYLIQTSDGFTSVGGLGPRSADLHGTVFGRACEQIVSRIPATMVKEIVQRDFGVVRIWKLDWASIPATPREDEFPSRP